jgi:hypothetical protein
MLRHLEAGPEVADTLLAMLDRLMETAQRPGAETERAE